MAVYRAQHGSATFWLDVPSRTTARRLVKTLGAALFTVAFAVALLPEFSPAEALPFLAAEALPLVAVAAAVWGRSRSLMVGSAILVILVLPTKFVANGAVNMQIAVVAALASGALIAANSRTMRKHVDELIVLVRALRFRDDRRSRQFAAIDRVGRLLAEDGASRERLNLVIDLLVGEFGYSSAAVFLSDGPILRAAAWTGYTAPVLAINGSMGIVGRVLRTGQSALVPDVRQDSDYVSANDDTLSELVVPLKVDGELLGILNIDSSQAGALDESDLELGLLVAERVATAIILGRDKSLLAQRAAMFRALLGFSTAISGGGVSADFEPRLVAATLELFPADDLVALLSPSKIEAWIASAAESPQSTLALAACQEALATERVVSKELVEESQVVLGRQERDTPYAAAALPLVRNSQVIGLLILTRMSQAEPFTALEAEAMPLAATHAASAAIAAQLLAEAEETSVRDALTGLHNRRYFQEAGPRALAASRRSRHRTRPLCAVLFDLDHFSAINNQHGHQTGDAILREFGAVLSNRLRASDIVARYGGEEFVLLLEEIPVDAAVLIANEIRAMASKITVACPDGCQVGVTVSAGLAVADDASTLESLVHRADSALYEAKKTGRDRVCVFGADAPR
jgi:diguanylate cyclase (GGDEF)-like protein